MSVTWVTAFLDSPPESAADDEQFWLGVTGASFSPRRGPEQEFATLLPPSGDPTLKVQRVRHVVPGGLHLDLHTDDVRALADRASALGATTSHHVLGYVICGSPGGMTFCLVGHPGRRLPEPVAWESGRSIVDQVCLDVPPHAYDAEVAFWQELTGWTRTQAGEFERLVRPAEVPLAFLVQRLQDEQPTTTAHLDLSADDRDAEVARHVALGATLVHRAEHWTVLTDPGGRTYCVTGRRPGDV